MAVVEQDIEIDRPVAQVFPRLLDTDGPLHLGAAVERDGAVPTAPGDRFAQAETLLGRRVRWTYEVDAIDPGRGAAVHAVGAPFPVQVWVRTEEIDGRTRVTVRRRADALMVFTSETLVREQLETGLRTELAMLKRVLEAA